MNKKPLILWGATGQSIMLEETLRKDYDLIALFDNNNEIKSPFKNIEIHHGWDSFLNWKNNQMSELYYVVAIGGSYGQERLQLHNMLKKAGLNPISAIHNKAYVSEDAYLGEGSQILPMASVNARVKVGKCTIINTSASIDHECILGDGVHIGPGAKLAGRISIGDNSFVGTNSTILPNIKIGKNVTIGAGSVVTRDIDDNIVGYGNPFKEKNK